MAGGAPEEAEILTPGVDRQALVRNATLVEPASDVVGLIETKLDSTRQRINEAFGVTLGDREGPGFIRYPEGGFYLPHRDRGDDLTWEGAARRAIALVLFLNASRECSPDGEFEGGILRIFARDADIDVVPEAGTLVAFPADLLHEVTEVRGGTRDTVVDWFYFTGREGSVRDSGEAAARPGQSAGNAS